MSDASLSASSAQPSLPLTLSSSVRLTVAPMEGLTGVVWRHIHARRFGGVDAYGIPFISPTKEPLFTDRQLREIAREANKGLSVVPQILTRNAEDFVWAAKSLMDLGYKEVNLNLGCPAGTVVAKGKGSGFLRLPVELDGFLTNIFRALGDEAPVTVKTRLGWSDVAEFENLTEIFSRHPIKRLIVHPRLKTDFYKGVARYSVLAEHLCALNMPIGINGDMVTVGDVLRRATEYPQAEEIMIGRGVIADPALFRKLRGGAAASRDEFFDFADELLDGFCEAFGSVPNSIMRMKEYWFYMQNLLDDPGRMMKALYKAKKPADYFDAVKALRNEVPLLQEAHPGWAKPL